MNRLDKFFKEMNRWVALFIKGEIIFLIISFVLLSLVSGCASLGPSLVDPSVYGASRDATVAGYNADTERSFADAQINKTEQLNQQLERERMQKRQAIMLQHMETVTSATSPITTPNIMTEAGDMVGGVPAIFINNSSYTKTVYIKKLWGDLGGRQWRFKIASHDEVIKHLPPGNYSIQWILGDWGGRLYPQEPEKFQIHMEPRFYTEGGAYHGGYELLD